MPAHSTPAAEVEITADLVAILLAEQHPDLADRDIVEVAFGFDCVIYRLGADLLVRMPRREIVTPSFANEQRWLPTLAPHLPLAVPAPVRIGQPGAGYPWPWSICPWFPGDIASRQMPDDLEQAARDLGAFLRALHVPAPAEAPVNPYRSVDLRARDASVQDRLEHLDDRILIAEARAVWSAAVELPSRTGPAVWVHGDLHPSNILVNDGRITAVIDFVDLCAGDAATDLSVAWVMFPKAARAVLRESAGGVDDDTWRRARGWALFFGVMLATIGDNPDFLRIGRSAIEAVLTD